MTETPTTSTPLELPQEIAIMVGRIAAVWAETEFEINSSIWALAGVGPTIGACMTSQIYSFDARMKALLSLLKLRQAQQKLIDSANKFSANLRTPLELRNRAIHDCWLWDTSGATYRLEIASPNKLRFELKNILETDLKSDYEKIIAFLQKARALKDEICGALSSLPETPPPELGPIGLPLPGR